MCILIWSGSFLESFTKSFVQLIRFLTVFDLLFHLFLSKMENRLQRRPRSTSMKDRQNSKAQNDRTSSMESECSPDSRLIAQVNDSQMSSSLTVQML